MRYFAVKIFATYLINFKNSIKDIVFKYLVFFITN